LKIQMIHDETPEILSVFYSKANAT
jgi:hypothetical protein